MIADRYRSGRLVFPKGGYRAENAIVHRKKDGVVRRYGSQMDVRDPDRMKGLVTGARPFRKKGAGAAGEQKIIIAIHPLLRGT